MNHDLVVRRRLWFLHPQRQLAGEAGLHRDVDPWQVADLQPWASPKPMRPPACTSSTAPGRGWSPRNRDSAGKFTSSGPSLTGRSCLFPRPSASVVSLRLSRQAPASTAQRHATCAIEGRNDEVAVVTGAASGIMPSHWPAKDFGSSAHTSGIGWPVAQRSAVSRWCDVTDQAVAAPRAVWPPRRWLIAGRRLRRIDRCRRRPCGEEMYSVNVSVGAGNQGLLRVAAVTANHQHGVQLPVASVIPAGRLPRQARGEGHDRHHAQKC